MKNGLQEVKSICCLCGHPGTSEDPITREHVPPRQFYPKALRNGLNLWIVPAHKSCNNAYKHDEEYFYHALFALVANVNRSMANAIINDIKRRARKPQSVKLIRRILRDSRRISESGIILPPGKVCIEADETRLQRVAIKIGRCLFFRDQNRMVPDANCKDIWLCESAEDVPEYYRLSWNMTKVNLGDLVSKSTNGIVTVQDLDAGAPLSAYREVFDYRSYYLKDERLHFYSLRFWKAFMYCMAFEDP